MIAHTFLAIPMFYNDTEEGVEYPYPVQIFPEPLVQASVRYLEASFGSLQGVPSTFAKFQHNGTVFLLSTFMFLCQGLQLLACQLTSLDEFLGQAGSSSKMLAQALAHGDQALAATAALAGVLAEVSQSTVALMEQTSTVTESVKASKSVTLVVQVVIICGSLVVAAVVVMRVIQVVRVVSLEMCAVAQMEIHDIQASSSVFFELSSVQHSFSIMAECLGQYKPFLPHGLSYRLKSEFFETSEAKPQGVGPVLSSLEERSSIPELPAGPSISRADLSPRIAPPRTMSRYQQPLCLFRFGTVLYVHFWGSSQRQRCVSSMPCHCLPLSGRSLCIVLTVPCFMYVGFKLQFSRSLPTYVALFPLRPCRFFAW